MKYCIQNCKSYHILYCISYHISYDISYPIVYRIIYHFKYPIIYHNIYPRGYNGSVGILGDIGIYCSILDSIRLIHSLCNNNTSHLSILFGNFLCDGHRHPHVRVLERAFDRQKYIPIFACYV